MTHQEPIRPTDQEERIADLGVSAKLVYKILEYEGSLTQKEITQHGWLHERTARYAIADLKDAGAITESPYARDARQSLYTIVGETSPRDDDGDDD